jgi:nucleotide-binding universal stress UspA family protein
MRELTNNHECIYPKTVTVFLDASVYGERRAAHAASLAQRWDSHLVGVYSVYEGVELPPSMSYARGKAAFRQVVDLKQRLEAVAEAKAAEVQGHFQSVCAQLNVSAEFRPIGKEDAAAAVIRNALASDLVVVGCPEPHGLPDSVTVEKLLLTTGVPLLIVPNAWNGEAIGSKIVVGWNSTRQARRAVADAMAFLTTAKSVTVLVVNQDGQYRSGERPGADIARNLGRHGARVAVEEVNSNGFSVTAVILGYAEFNASDLLVVGAYSRARLKEILLGGTTRTLLGQTPMPTLMSR